ncbi:Histone-lysine N-methyltransferase ATXR6 [Ananas comosus]|uniref:[histone H3]-lysine(27) N-methyltransferase n=1 Tax=Ananas comosus TaxID=4615 RepID=A0A199VZK3_ANACO|nr:Histone-lysine N-methyltransferase ATXR6 [Ananas comosus]
MAPKTPFRRRTHAAPCSNGEGEGEGGGDGGADSVRCDECGSGDSPAELLLCDACDRGLHLFCLRPILARVPQGPWFCPSCSSLAKPKRGPTAPRRRRVLRRRRRKAGASAAAKTKKKSRKLLPFTPSDDPNRRLQQMASLATALTATAAAFSNELTYVPGMAPRSANSPALEHGGMQVLSKEDTETLNLCRSMMERGEWPPLLVVHDPLEGFTVEADRFIKDLTIITEYVGDVDYLKNREHDDGDSMMTLLSAKDPSKSLVICPDKRSNIARFINGINNHTPDGRKKQNLKCVRFDVNGECRVLLIAIRDIAKGERLYYDYNGSEQEYPTHHFV